MGHRSINFNQTDPPLQPQDSHKTTLNDNVKTKAYCKLRRRFVDSSPPPRRRSLYEIFRRCRYSKINEQKRLETTQMEDTKSNLRLCCFLNVGLCLKVSTPQGCMQTVNKLTLKPIACVAH